MLAQWEGESQGFGEEGDGGRQIGREEDEEDEGERKRVRGSVAQRCRLWRAVLLLVVVVVVAAVPMETSGGRVEAEPPEWVSSDGRAIHVWHLPRSHLKWPWHLFLLLHIAPTCPGWSGRFTAHMLFLHSRSGAHPSAALHSWPLQPKTQVLEAGMKGLSGISVRRVRGERGAGR